MTGKSGMRPENVAGPVELGVVSAEDADGDALTYGLVAGDAARFAVRGRDGAVTYVGLGEDFETEPNRFGLTVRVRDTAGGEARAEVTVTVINVNEPPVAVNDAERTEEDRAAVFDVLVDDTDPDGDRLRVASVSGARHGSTQVASDGGVEYTPELNYHGPDRFTYVVTDAGGETASASVAVTVVAVNDAPAPVGSIPDQSLDEGGGSTEVDLTPFFQDVDGDVLTYRAVSSGTDVVTVAVTGALLTLAPVVYGSAAVTVTAEDPGGLTAAQTFTVGVDDRLVRGVLGDTLAAMARSHLASARMTLGRRVTSGAGEESRLTVMGRPVPLGKAAARTAAAQALAGWLSSASWPGRQRHAVPGSLGPVGTAPRLGAHPVGILGAPVLGAAAGGMMPGAAGGPLRGFGAFGSGSDGLLHGTEFQLALGGGEAGERAAGRRWGVWGQGGIQTFQGTPTVFGYDAGYGGDVRTGYVGLDARLTERWLAGLAMARSGSGGDWSVGASSGRLRATLTTLHPYAQWSDGSTSVWAMAGGGWGAAENVRDATGQAGTSDLGLRLGLVEVRRRVGAVGGGAAFGLRADAARAQLRTGAGGESVDGLAAGVSQQRVGAEVSRPVRLDGLALDPFGEAHLRRDGGAGQTGTGVEVAFGVRAQGGIVRIEAQGRTLAVHSAAGYRERGAAVSLSIGGQDREELSLSISPRWGDAAVGAGTLWQEEVYRRYLPEAAQERWAVDARGDYGMRLPTGGLLTWFGSFSHSPYGHRRSSAACAGIERR